jgi:hypothetical protein
MPRTWLAFELKEVCSKIWYTKYPLSLILCEFIFLGAPGVLSLYFLIELGLLQMRN